MNHRAQDTQFNEMNHKPNQAKHYGKVNLPPT